MRRFSTILCAVGMVVLQSGAVFAGDGGDGVAQFRPRPISTPEPRFGVGVKAGTLGIGVQAGTALAPRVNLRGGANFFSYNDSLNKDGALYTGTLNLKSVEAKLDLFVIGGFRVTPGLLLYNDNNIAATVTTPAGQSITLGGTTYVSNVADPIRGTAGLTMNRFAPTIGIGFGNLLPRSARHFSLSTDLGVAFVGTPQFALGLTGSACATNGTNCQPMTTPSIAASVESQRLKIANDVKDFKYYPELSVMFGWKF